MTAAEIFVLRSENLFKFRMPNDETLLYSGVIFLIWG